MNVEHVGVCGASKFWSWSYHLCLTRYYKPVHGCVRGEQMLLHRGSLQDFCFIVDQFLLGDLRQADLSDQHFLVLSLLVARLTVLLMTYGPVY